jgi:hypothetical protein
MGKDIPMIVAARKLASSRSPTAIPVEELMSSAAIAHVAVLSRPLAGLAQ